MADPLTEKKAEKRQAEQRLRDLTAEHLRTKSAAREILNRQAAGKALDTDAAALAAADASAATIEASIQAATRLVNDLANEEAQLEAQDAADKARVLRGEGRFQVTNNAEADPKRGFASHREYFTAVMKAGMTGRVDERLKMLATQGSDEAQGSSLGYGGFLMPKALAPGLLALPSEGDVLAPYITNVPMAAPTVSYNARVDKDHSSSVSGGLTVSRRPETVDGTSSRMQFEQVTLTANEEFGLAYATERILTDSPQSFVAILQAGFRDEYVANAMRERIRGTGVGERQGVLNTPCLITVNKETGQTADTIVTENIDKMSARCWRYGSAVWLANHGTRPQLAGLTRAVGTGGVASNYFMANPGGQETLGGRPIFFTEFASAIGDLGDLILGNWSEYLEGQYESEQYAESIHVRFAAAERAFRFYRRNDGQWWWRSALTPKYGSTLSPAVVLQAR